MMVMQAPSDGVISAGAEMRGRNGSESSTSTTVPLSFSLRAVLLAGDRVTLLGT